MTLYTVMSSCELGGILVLRVCDGSALGHGRQNLTLQRFWSSVRSDLGKLSRQLFKEKTDPNRTDLIELLMAACCQAWHGTDWKFLPPNAGPESVRWTSVGILKWNFTDILLVQKDKILERLNWQLIKDVVNPDETELSGMLLLRMTLHRRETEGELLPDEI